MKPENLIFSRPDKKIYKSGDKLIKLFEASYSKADILNEALNHARVEETDLNVPQLISIEVVEGKWAIILDFIEGETLQSLMEKHPEKQDEYLDLFVDLQRTVLSKKVPMLNKLKDKMKEKQVRFDKSRPIDINWDKVEMKKMLSRRLEYFAVDKSKTSEILVDEQQLDKIIEMANGSPRQLTMLLARIYEEQSKINTTARVFSEEAVRLGMQNFSQTFEYELFFPGMTIKDVVNRILKVGKIKFSINDLAGATKKSPQTASNWIRTMKNIGFVEEIEGDSGKAKIYNVIDPKIIYMIENKLNYVG